MVNINSMDGRLEINVMDYKLKIMSIKKSAISKFTHALLDVIFLKHYRNKAVMHDNHGFVSVTETNEDYSVIVEEGALSAFDVADEDLQVSEDTWLAMAVSAGPMLVDSSAAGISKIAESVIIPLADFGVSVYCLSTYRTDYILILENDLDLACEILAYNFHLTRDDALQSREIIVPPEKIKIPSRVNRKYTSQALARSFTCPGNKFFVTSMDRNSLSSHALTIMDLLFFSGKRRTLPEDYDQFLSLSIIEQDISLILDSSLINRFPQNILFHTSDCWHMIKIGDMPEGLGFRRSSIIAQISEPIASAHIPEYYISSFFNGHTLVPVEQFNQVKKILECKQTIPLRTEISQN